MPSVKDVMTQQANLPQKIEVSLPAGVPKVSDLMKNVAASAPDIQLPALPFGGAGTTPALPTTFPNIIQGIQEVIQPAIPASGARTESTAPAALGASRRIMGGGYRSI